MALVLSHSMAPKCNKITKFFHGTTTQRKKKNFIKGLKYDNGVWHEDKDKVSSLLNEY